MAADRARRRRFPLRVRATVAFGVTALVLSGVLSTVGYALVRRSLVSERESSAERQAYLNARLLRTRLRTAEPEVATVLSGLQLSADGNAVLRWRGQWFASSVDLDPGSLPPRVVRAADGGNAARRTVDLNEEPVVVVGVPIREVDARYYEVVPLGDLNRTLNLFAWSLLGAGAGATLAAAAVGAAAAGAVLRPVTRIANVAREIVAGALDTRLAADGDPDLEPLAASFNEMLDDLRERIVRESRFASDVTHELRGPLAALSSAVQVVDRRRGELPETVVTAVDALAAQVESFNSLVLDLLEISRFDAGAAQLDLRELEIEPFVRNVLNEVGGSDAPILAGEGVPTHVLADARRLHQVLVNLVRNAEQYAGGVTSVELSASAESVRIAVVDSGPGVKPHERDVIFGRFARGAAADERSAPSGTGLGLALAVEHVRLHGGRMWVENAPVKGSRFVVELPVEPL